VILDAIGIVIGIGILVFVIGGGIWARSAEKREWNGGTCRENGLAWECFDVDSSGARGYKTHSRVGGVERRVIWISYGVDR
jgi:hypothetical protein